VYNVINRKFHTFFRSIFFVLNIHSQEWVRSNCCKCLLSLFNNCNFTCNFCFQYFHVCVCLPIFSFDLQIFFCLTQATAENLVLQLHCPDEIVRLSGWILQQFLWHKYRNFGSLYVYFSNLNKLQNKKIRIAALRRLSIICYYCEHSKDSSQKNYPSEVKILIRSTLQAHF